MIKEEYYHLLAIKKFYPWAIWVLRRPNSKLYLFREEPIVKGFSFLNVKGAWDIFPVDDFLPSLTCESEPLNIDEALTNRT